MSTPQFPEETYYEVWKIIDGDTAEPVIRGIAYESNAIYLAEGQQTKADATQAMDANSPVKPDVVEFIVVQVTEKRAVLR